MKCRLTLTAFWFAFSVSRLAAAPVLNLSTDTLKFFAVQGARDPVARTIQLSNSGDAPANYIVQENALWILSGMPNSGGVSPGGAPFDFTVTVDPNNRAAGVLRDSVAFAGNFPSKILRVVFTISGPQPAPRKGDLNGDGRLSSGDLVLLQNCVFLGAGNCSLPAADINGDGALTSQDVVLLQNAVFLGAPLPC